MQTNSLYLSNEDQPAFFVPFLHIHTFCDVDGSDDSLQWVKWGFGSFGYISQCFPEVYNFYWETLHSLCCTISSLPVLPVQLFLYWLFIQMLKTRCIPLFPPQCALRLEAILSERSLTYSGLFSDHRVGWASGVLSLVACSSVPLGMTRGGGGGDCEADALVHKWWNVRRWNTRSWCNVELRTKAVSLSSAECSL